ncbi:MAG: SoxR reducing system RseC family protein [Clostridia bacterium]|nr:SoxR reducing system RseC family protein [Clostridia bacterium]
MSSNISCTGEKPAIVIKEKNGVAKIKVVRSSACGECKACILGSTENSVLLPARNEVGAKQGDTVYFTAKQKPWFATLLLFLLPLTLLLVGLILSLAFSLGELVSVAIGVGCMAVGFITVLILDKTVFSKKHLAQITRVEKMEDNTND